ncbi:MAG: carboxyl-terminal processing protease, partial [Thermoleophilaceae bacterium]|nr:carboxyl-terminal processing protease [Thermoleophilaceae bacterium]
MSKGVLALLAALAALVVGIWLGGHPAGLPGPVRDALVPDDTAVRAEIIDSIEDNYYKPVNEKKLDEASLKGIVDALGDPYSHYLTPKEAKQFSEQVSGHFEGVGMKVEEDRRGRQVLRVFDGSPAERAGIRAGDFI